MLAATAAGRIQLFRLVYVQSENNAFVKNLTLIDSFFSTYAKAIIKKELTTKRGPRSSNRFLLNPTDRRRLENSIPQTSHRGLRMLCADEVLNMNIDCPIDASRGEFACVRVEDIRLDINKIKDLVEPILRKLVNPPGNDGYFDLVCNPASYLDYPIPGISDVAGVSQDLLSILCCIICSPQLACFIYIQYREI